MKKVIVIAIAVLLVLGTICLTACDFLNGITAEETIRYTVTFDSQGGTTVNRQKVVSGDKIKKPNDPTKDDSIFIGWFESPEKGEEWNFSSSVVTKDMILFAHWENVKPTDAPEEKTPETNEPDFHDSPSDTDEPTEPETPNEPTEPETPNEPTEPETPQIVMFTVIFMTNGGTEIKSDIVASGEYINKPSDPQRNGYHFDGWFDMETNGTLWNFETNSIDKDTVLYAYWTKSEPEPVATESLTYERNTVGYTVTGADGDEETIIIPAVYNGLPVTVIGEGAFAYSKHTADIISVTIPDTVTLIEKNAFYARSELSEIKIGVNSGLKEIQNNAFSGCGALKEIYLPKTLEKLGGGTTNPSMEDPVAVFNNCGSIESFVVANDNPYYSSENGHLIEKTTGTLLRGCNGNPVIPTCVTEIAKTAFRKTTLKRLYIPVTVIKIGNYIIQNSEITQIDYEGTEEQWNAIEKTKYWNMGKTDIDLSFEK